jgi:hypothetical protein
MLISWWWLWIAFLVLFIVPPVGYGWAYRGWGPPYPRYIQRRRGQHTVGVGSPVTFNHQSWGWGGDFVWVMFLIAVFLAVTAFWRTWR